MTEIIKTLVALAKKRMTQHEKAQKGKTGFQAYWNMSSIFDRCVTFANFFLEKRIEKLQKAIEREELNEKLRREMLIKRRSNVRQPSWLSVEPIRSK